MEFYDDELYHHGIKGMKRGVRRGPPYPLGGRASTSLSKSKKTKRKNNILSKLSKRKTKKKTSAKSQKKEDTSKKIKSMSDSELRDLVTRLSMEKKLKDLMKEGSHKEVSRGRKFVYDVLEQSGKNLAVPLLTYAGGTIINNLAGAKVIPTADKKKKS